MLEGIDSMFNNFQRINEAAELEDKRCMCLTYYYADQIMNIYGYSYLKAKEYANEMSLMYQRNEQHSTLNTPG